MTLIELLVSLAILSVIGVSLGAAMSAGLRFLGPAGAGDRIAAANALIAVERAVTPDLRHAECVVVSGSLPVGDCVALASASSSVSVTCAGGVVCAVWCAGGGSWAAAAYRFSGGVVERDGSDTSVVHVASGISSFSAGRSGGDGTAPITTTVQVSAGASATRTAQYRVTTLSVPRSLEVAPC